MVRRKMDRQTGRLFRNASGQEELFEKSYEEKLEAQRARPVECFGMVFESDGARRDHFLGRLEKGLEELHAKLSGVPFTIVDDAVARMAAIEHWPMGDEARRLDLAKRMSHADPSKDLLHRWKDEVGFPHGRIKDILDLSDPPYYTACPNPFLDEFVKAHGKPYDPDEAYSRKPFAVDVSEGKTHPVYRAHSYHTKVPHLAIVPSILHYTEPGDLVLDGFAGSGMTGVAALWSEIAPENYRESLETAWTRENHGQPRWGVRHTVQNELSPLASSIAANYSLPFDLEEFAKAGRTLLDDVERELGWMYETIHSDGETKGRIDYTVWSEVFSCPECTEEILFFEEALDQTSGRVRDTFTCPNCDTELNKNRLERLFQSDIDAATGQMRKHVTFIPVLIRYTVNGRLFEKTIDANDQEVIRRIADLPLPSEVPTDCLPIDEMYHGSRLAPKGITHVSSLLPAACSPSSCSVVARSQLPLGPSHPPHASVLRGASHLDDVDPEPLPAYGLFSGQSVISREFTTCPSQHFRRFPLICTSEGQAQEADQSLRRTANTRTTLDHVIVHEQATAASWSPERNGGLHFHRPAIRRKHLLRGFEFFGRILARRADKCGTGSDYRSIQEERTTGVSAPDAALL